MERCLAPNDTQELALLASLANTCAIDVAEPTTSTTTRSRAHLARQMVPYVAHVGPLTTYAQLQSNTGVFC